MLVGYLVKVVTRAWKWDKKCQQRKANYKHQHTNPFHHTRKTLSGQNTKNLKYAVKEKIWKIAGVVVTHDCVCIKVTFLKSCKN